MKRKKAEGKEMKRQRAAFVRASISFPADLYETLEALAKQKKVSLAWVVRDASEGYIAKKAVSTAGSRTDQRRRQSVR
jgi:metal-responsive CopG/Arc/MetJ family transcriptional regulator